MARCLVTLSIAASLAAQAGPDDLPDRVQRALDRARPAMVRDLGRTHGDPLALCCLAALHDGMGDDDAALVRAIDRLARLRTNSTYALSLRIWVAADFAGYPDRAQALQRDLADLLAHQAPDGGFGYLAGTGYWDLSNTQYAALGLRAAAGIGLDVLRPAWQRLFDAVLRVQQEDGSFTYGRHEGPDRATLSMTAAGIGVVETCRQQLGLDVAEDRRAAAAIERAWRWLERDPDRIGGRDVPNCLYAHWGLERAAILSGRERIGPADWYRRGAEMILAMQRPDGAFQSPTDSHGKKVQTAFAVLFLRRAFRREPGLAGPARPVSPLVSCAALDPQATDEEIRHAARRDAEQGDAIVPALVQQLASPHLSRRSAAARALVRISGRDFGYHPARSADDNAAALGRIEIWWRERQRAAQTGKG